MKPTMTYHANDIITACEQIGLDRDRFFGRLEAARIRRQFDSALARRNALQVELGSDATAPIESVDPSRLSLRARFAAADEEFERCREARKQNDLAFMLSEMSREPSGHQ